MRLHKKYRASSWTINTTIAPSGPRASYFNRRSTLPVAVGRRVFAERRGGGASPRLTAAPAAQKPAPRPAQQPACRTYREKIHTAYRATAGISSPLQHASKHNILLEIDSSETETRALSADARSSVHTNHVAKSVHPFVSRCTTCWSRFSPAVARDRRRLGASGHPVRGRAAGGTARRLQVWLAISISQVLSN